MSDEEYYDDDDGGNDPEDYGEEYAMEEEEEKHDASVTPSKMCKLECKFKNQFNTFLIGLWEERERMKERKNTL